MSSKSGETQASKGSSTGISGGETSIRVVIFSGKKEDWESWKEKFLVKASIRGYESVLTGETKIPATHDEDGNKLTLTAEEQEIVEQNKKGFGDLILSIDCSTAAGKVAFATIKNTKTKEHPGGNVRNAFNRLKQKYEPSTTPQLMQLTKDFHSKVLKPNQDPDMYITELEAIKVQMEELDHSMTDKSLIIHVLNNLPKDYDMEIKMLEMRMQQLKEQGKELSVEDVRTELNLRYERIKRNNPPQKAVEYAYYMGGKFKGKCHWCGKIGHKTAECRLRISGKPKLVGNNGKNSSNNNLNENNGIQNKVNRKNLFCTYCKIKGHEVSECRKKKCDKSMVSTVTNNTGTSLVKEVACMAFERRVNSDQPTFGTCIGCSRLGPAFSYCTSCGEDTGMIYYPEQEQQNTNQSHSTES